MTWNPCHPLQKQYRKFRGLLRNSKKERLPNFRDWIFYVDPCRTLDRIERKISDSMGTRVFTDIASPAPLIDAKGRIGNPREEYVSALRQGNIGKAAAILKQLEQLLDTTEVIGSAYYLSIVGHEPAADLIYQNLFDSLEELAVEGEHNLTTGISAIAQFYIVRDREVEGIPRLEPIIERVRQMERSQ